jgi:hypothetical protein
MTRRTKGIIAILTTLFIACICCSGVGLFGFWNLSRAFITDAAEARDIGAEIADYTLPSGYGEVIGMRVLGNEMVAIRSDLTSVDSMLIMLMKVSNAENVNQADVEKQLELAVKQQFVFQGLNLTFDRVESRLVNGEEVTLTFRKGEDGVGTPYQQMNGLFNSHKGRGFIFVQGPESSWDQDAIDSLLDSIR